MCLACRIEKSWEEGEGQEKQTPTLLQGRLCGRNHRPATERLRQEDVLSPGIPGHPIETLSHKEQNKTLEAQPLSLSLWRKSPGYAAETVFAPLRRVGRQPQQGGVLRVFPGEVTPRYPSPWPAGLAVPLHKGWELPQLQFSL